MVADGMGRDDIPATARNVNDAADQYPARLPIRAGVQIGYDASLLVWVLYYHGLLDLPITDTSSVEDVCRVLRSYRGPLGIDLLPQRDDGVVHAIASGIRSF